MRANNSASWADVHAGRTLISIPSCQVTTVYPSRCACGLCSCFQQCRHPNHNSAGLICQVWTARINIISSKLVGSRVAGFKAVDVCKLTLGLSSRMAWNLPNLPAITQEPYFCYNSQHLVGALRLSKIH